MRNHKSIQTTNDNQKNKLKNITPIEQSWIVESSIFSENEYWSDQYHSDEEFNI